MGDIDHHIHRVRKRWTPLHLMIAQQMKFEILRKRCRFVIYRSVPEQERQSASQMTPFSDLQKLPGCQISPIHIFKDQEAVRRAIGVPYRNWFRAGDGLECRYYQTEH